MLFALPGTPTSQIPHPFTSFRPLQPPAKGPHTHGVSLTVAPCAGLFPQGCVAPSPVSQGRKSREHPAGVTDRRKQPTQGPSAKPGEEAGALTKGLGRKRYRGCESRALGVTTKATGQRRALCLPPGVHPAESTNGSACLSLGVGDTAPAPSTSTAALPE